MITHGTGNRVLLFLTACCGSLTTGAGAEFTLRGYRFQVPDGFEVSVAAEPPLIQRPITCDYDEQGRLYVAESSGTNDDVHQQLKERPHWITRLEDTDEDGVYDRKTVFADKMMFPEGTLWYDGSLYVSAPPSIWKLTDTDGDGRADLREEWLRQTLNGCANDLHGPYLGPDGWIYWCKGAFEQQTYDRPGQEPWVTRAAHIFRARPDGSGLEPVMTGGMDNPVDVAFTPEGQRIFTTTFLQHPQGGQRDGLIHAIYGGVYGKRHGVIDSHPRTGDVMPILTHLGPAAPCGLMRYESRAFGNSYRDNLFAALFNLHKVTRHVLQRAGTTFRSEDSDFLVADSPDFHPTDVIEDADGSILVIDTGGWYKLCCPTSQLWKPDIPGAIYRVRRTRATRPVDPLGKTMDWQVGARQLVDRLGDERPAVRRHAMKRLAAQGSQALPALRAAMASARPVAVRRAALWTLCRIEGPAARALVRQALTDEDLTTRLISLHSIALGRDSQALEQVRARLKSDEPFERRCAAQAIGRMRQSSGVSALLEAASTYTDRSLEHALIFALIEIGDERETRVGLRSRNRYVQRVAAVALCEMADPTLTPSDIANWLSSPHRKLRETAEWIVDRRADWGEELLVYFGQQLKSAGDLEPVQRGRLVRRLARLAVTPSTRAQLAAWFLDADVGRHGRELLVQALGQAGPSELPSDWLSVICSVLAKPDPTSISQAVRLARAFPREAIVKHKSLVDTLLRTSRNVDLELTSRLAALDAVVNEGSPVETVDFALLWTACHDQRATPTSRLMAAETLARAKLKDAQLLKLTGAVQHAGPFELPPLLEAFHGQTDERLGTRLLQAVRDSPSFSSLRPDQLSSCVESFPDSVKEASEQLLATLNVDLAQQRKYLDKLLRELPEGNVRRGQLVFNGNKAACSTCHEIGYLGGNLGPDLTTIGTVRSPRDLLESIVFPSMSFVRSYESTRVLTHDGRQYSGILREASDDRIVLIEGPDKEHRIDRAEVEVMLPGSVSIMPAGMDKQLTQQELADLLAFLQATKWR